MTTGRWVKRSGAVMALATAIVLIAMAGEEGAKPSSAAHVSPGVVATIPVDIGPWNVAVNPVTNRIYVVHKVPSKLSVIDGGTNSVVTVIELPWEIPFGIGVNPNTNRVYVAYEDGVGELTVIDGGTNSIVAGIPNANSAGGVAVNADTNRVYVARATCCSGGGEVLVINGATHSEITRIPLATSPDGVALNPSTGRLYATDWLGIVTYVIDTVSNQVIDSIAVGGNVAVNPATDRVYIGGLYIGGLTVVDGATNEVLTTVAAAAGRGIAVNSATGKIYATRGDFGKGRVSIVDAPTNTVQTMITVGNYPIGVAVNPATDRVYTANLDDAFVSVIGNDGDADLDGVPNAGDNCPNWPNTEQNLPTWAVPPGDPDCDGFSSSSESSIGTMAFVPCDWKATANDDDPDAWPPDFDDSKAVNISDVLALKPVFGTAVPPTSARYDIVPGGGINIADVLALKPFFGQTCTP